MSAFIYARKVALVAVVIASVIVQNGCILKYIHKSFGGPCFKDTAYGSEDKKADRDYKNGELFSLAGEQVVCYGEWNEKI